MAQPWGRGYLVLSDGVKVNASTGLIADGYPYTNQTLRITVDEGRFGEVAQHFIASVTQGNVVSYKPDCVSSNNRILITTVPMQVTKPSNDAPGPPIITSDATSLLSDVLPVIAFVLLHVLLVAYIVGWNK